MLKIEKEDKYGTTAVVEDTININLRKNIRIIEFQRDTSEFIEYMKINHSEYRSFRYPYLAEFYYFNKISNIDNKPLGGNKFYITSEDFEGLLLFEQVRNKSFNKVLDLVAQLCSTLKYLHLRGYLICNINVDELSIIEKSGQTMIKISSLPYLDGIDSSIMIDKDNNYFKAPEVFQGKKYTRQSDIYLLGAIIFHMFNNIDIGNQNLRDALADFSPEKNSELYKLKRIIMKCTALRLMDRYASVDQLIADINISFSKSYPLVETQYIGLIPTRLVKLFFRENYMKRVIANAKSHIFESRNINVTFIQGAIGTGKTSFLTNAFYRLQQEGIDCTLSKLNENIRSSFGVITYVVKELMKHTDREILDKYSSDLHYLMPELIDNANGVITQSELNKESKMRLIYRIGNFLLEVAIRHPFAVAVIGIEWIDEDSFEIFKYIINNTDKGRIHFIFSSSLEFESESELLKDSLKKLKSSGNTDKILFVNYNINETAEYIRLILGMDQAPLDFAANIYKETEGNPNHIYELIYLLYNKKQITVGDDGNWKLKGVDFKKLKLSLNINEIVFDKINNLTNIEKETLRIISLFNTAVPSDILEEMTGKKIESLYMMFTRLETINMISKKVDDWGISYDYSSINVKKTIYEKIPEDERLEYHKRVAIILEKKFSRENRENRDELIYHLTKANNIDAAIKLLMTSADKMLESNLINQAIQFLEQSFNLFRKSEVCINKIEICLRLGNLYEQVGEYNKAIYLYDIAEDIAKKMQDKKLHINVYLHKIKIMYKQNNVKSCIKYAIDTKKLLRDIDYIEGMYELILSLSDLMINRRRYSLYINILERVLEQIDMDKDESIYARFLLVYGRHLWAIRRYDEAFSILQKAEKIFERTGQFKYLPQILNTLGACIVENNSDLHKAREYFEKTLSISQKVNNLRYIETSYNNLSELLIIEDKYSEAMEYYNNALEVVKITQNTNLNNLVHINKVLVLMFMEEYKNTLEFIGISEKLFNNYKDSGNNLEFFYRCKAEYNYRLGYYELAKAYAQKSVDMCISWGIPHNMESIFLKQISEIHITEKLNFKQDMVLCKGILEDNMYKLGRVACLQLAEIYTSKELQDEARAFMKLGLSYVDKIETDILRVEYKYIDAITSNEEDKQIKLIQAATYMENIENLEIKWKIYKAIAKTYQSKKEYQDALKYYISALNILRKLVHNVPDEYKTTFILSHGRNTVKEGLRDISEMIMNSKGLSFDAQTDVNKITLQNLDKYFDYTSYIDIYREGEEEVSEGKVDSGTYSKLLNKTRDLINKFSENNIENIKNIVDLCTEITQAKNAFIAILDEEDNLDILASYNRYSENTFYKYVIEQVKQKKDSIIVTDVFEYNNSKGDLLIPKEITSVFCIPIMGTKNEDELGLIKERRKQKIQNESSIIGYIYLDTDSIINNFTQESIHFCKLLSKIAYILVDNYYLKMVSTVDKLTKLYTRKYFETALQIEIDYSETEGMEFSVIMIDIDNFKTVNDRFGHQRGDEILQGVSGTIVSALRKGDIAARYGGEEIIILLPNTGEEEGINVAEKLRKKVENARLLGLHNPLTISVGVSTYPNHSTWTKDLIEKADQALYYAKENGKNLSCLYKEDMSKITKRINKLAGIISGNLVEDQRKVETMLEVLELQRSIDINKEEKLFNFLGRIIEVSEAQLGIIFDIEENREIRKKIVRKKFISTEVAEEYYNKEVVSKCIEESVGEYKVDWNSYHGVDSMTGMPEWQSIMVVPMTKQGELRGVLYLSAPIKMKEFDAGQYNFIKTLCDIISSIDF